MEFYSICKAVDMKMIFYSQANTTHFQKKRCAFGLILTVRVFASRKWPIIALAELCHPLSLLADRKMAGVGRGEER